MRSEPAAPLVLREIHRRLELFQRVPAVGVAQEDPVGPQRVQLSAESRAHVVVVVQVQVADDQVQRVCPERPQLFLADEIARLQIREAPLHHALRPLQCSHVRGADVRLLEERIC